MLDHSGIDAFFQAHQSQMVEDIRRLIAIKSVRGPESEEAPFGPGPACALDAAACLSKSLGLKVRELGRRIVTADMNDAPPKLGILVHLDVVEEGDGWTVPPYAGIVRDGKIYGRGAIDDKGPAVAALYALKAARTLDPALANGARVILGSAEETGSQDLAWYRSKEAMPPYVFSPDAEYPVINIEKGRYAPVFGESWPEEQHVPRVTAFHGGDTANIVPRTARAQVTGLDEEQLRPACEQAAQKTGVQFHLDAGPEGVWISAVGTGGHASRPEEANNAQTALLELLAGLPLAACRSTRAIRNLAGLFPHGDVHGQALGIAQQDAQSGVLTVNFSRLQLNGSGFSAQFDSRTPICATEDTVSLVTARRLAGMGMQITSREEMVPYHCTDAGSPFVRTLLDVYERHTGLKGECLAIGGGTYVHMVDGGVAYGCRFPGEDNRMHGPDEFIRIDQLMLSAKMFTEVILKMCR